MKMKMKKFTAVSLLVIMVLSLVLLGGCTAGSSSGVKTGLGHVISIAKSTDAADDKDGAAQVDALIAAVTVDGSGKILIVTFDAVQTRVSFSKAGAITADMTAEYKTKVELGNDYGLKKASALGKEWYEEVADLEKWMVGKTIDQITSMKVKTVEGKVITDEPDLTSKITVGIEDFLKAAEEAVKNAK